MKTDGRPLLGLSLKDFLYDVRSFYNLAISLTEWPDDRKIAARALAQTMTA